MHLIKNLIGKLKNIFQFKKTSKSNNYGNINNIKGNNNNVEQKNART